MHPLPTPPAGFLDAAGGQPLAEATMNAWCAASERAWAAPDRLYHRSRDAALLLNAARTSLAGVLQVEPTTLHLTPSSTAALQAAVHGLLRPGVRLVHSAIESLTVFHIADRWRAAGGAVSEIPVDALGHLDLTALQQALTGADPCIVAVQAANPEIGTMQRLTEIHQLTQAAGAPLIVDGTALIGHAPIPTAWDLLTADPRDWAGPPGIGLLAVRPSIPWHAPDDGARGWLTGPANVPAAVAAATALETVLPHIADQARLHHTLIDQIRRAVAGEDIDVLGDPNHRLPHVLTCSALFTSGEALVTALDQRGFSVASGSACVVDYERASHVLAAIGAFTGGNIRITLPYNVTASTVDAFIAAWPDALAAVREPI